MTLDETLEYMLASVPEEFDTSPGSFYYDLLYPVAEQLALKGAVISDLPDAVFALTASGTYLDRRAAEQGLERRAATYAEGVLTITGTAGSIVHAGSLAASGDVLYSTLASVTLPESGTADVAAVCTLAGAAGNAAAGKINRFPISLPGLASVTNAEPFSGGYDRESDDDLRERYFEKVSRPNASGNKNDYITWAKEVQGVGDAQVLPLWDGPGTVKVVITDIDTKPADEELIAEVKAHIEERRPIGAAVTVESAEPKEVDIYAILDTDGRDFETIEEECEAALTAYLAGEANDKRYVSIGRVCQIIMSAGGVEDCNGLKLGKLTSGYSIADGMIPVLGKLELIENFEIELFGGGDDEGGNSGDDQ